MASEKTQSTLKLFARIDIQPAMFFTGCLNDPERHYWLIRLKIAGIVRVVSKVRYMIESNL